MFGMQIKQNYPRLHCKHSQPHPPANPREKAKIERGGDLGSYTTPSVILMYNFNLKRFVKCFEIFIQLYSSFADKLIKHKKLQIKQIVR